MSEREVLINLRVSSEERDKFRAIAAANDEPYAQTVRRWIRTFYAQGFGDVVPMIFPRFGGRSDYAANAAICDLNSNSIGLT